MIKKLVVIVIGLIFVVSGIVMIFSERDIEKRCSEETEGNVIGIVEDKKIPSGRPKEEGSYYDAQKVYYPVIEYKAGEETISKKYSVGDEKIKYKIGEKIIIKYNPNKTDEYLIKEDNGKIYVGIILIVIGVICVLIGFFNKKLK